MAEVGTRIRAEIPERTLVWGQGEELGQMPLKIGRLAAIIKKKMP